MADSRQCRRTPGRLRRIALRAGIGRCFYCGMKRRVLHTEHLVPVSRGGPTESWNLVAACPACNADKGTETLAEWAGFVVAPDGEVTAGAWREFGRAPWLLRNGDWIAHQCAVSAAHPGLGFHLDAGALEGIAWV